MSASKTATLSLRILALPLSRCKGGSKSKSILDTYYHFLTPPRPEHESGKTNYVARIMQKASDVWAGFGKAEEGSWKLTTFRYGERMIDRLDFEELALKSLDPSLGPKLTRPIQSGSTAERPQIPIIFPKQIISSPLPNLRELLQRRTPRHRRGFWLWLLLSPLMAPFMLIPVIPNVPFFFCIWRSWHHYRAFKASEYLESLLNRGAIVPQASNELDQIYNAGLEDSEQPQLLLDHSMIPRIQETFKLPKASSADVNRALAQASFRLRNHSHSQH